jgi:hypothetical protein
VALDADGNTVDVQTRTGAQGDLGVDLDFLVSSAINEITQVQLIGDITWLSGYGIDDLVLGAAVPIPPALYLFGSGLLGLIGIARKKAA